MSGAHTLRRCGAQAAAGWCSQAEEQLQPPWRGNQSPRAFLACGQRAPRRRSAPLLSSLPVQRTTGAQSGNRTGQLTSGWDLAGLPLASPNTAQAEGREARRILFALPPSHATSSFCVAARSPKTPWELQGARARRRCTKWARHQAPPGWSAHSLPQSGVARPP